MNYQKEDVYILKPEFIILDATYSLARNFYYLVQDEIKDIYK